MRISEIYQSKQGEGLLTGTPSVFVRTSGCNLRCRFCDTPFTSWSPEGETRSLDQVVHEVCRVAGGATHVVVTGGEPMLPQDIVSLCRMLHESGFHITIETAGTIDRELACDLMSISPKLSNSDPDLERAGTWRQRHQQTRHQPEVVARLIHQYPHQLKFVVAAPEDVDEILSFLDEVEQQLLAIRRDEVEHEKESNLHSAPELDSSSAKTNIDPQRVLLMPEGIDQATLQQREAWLQPICDAHQFQLCRRMHILWYGNQRGT